ncbi:MAG: SusC/RagA family TonB-linked outer membrane protein [Bacteroidota bacterium]
MENNLTVPSPNCAFSLSIGHLVVGLLLAILVASSSSVLAQQLAFSAVSDQVAYQNEQQLQEYLDQLGTTHQVKFVYDSKLVDGKSVRQDVLSALEEAPQQSHTLDQVLQTILTPHQLTYEKVYDNYYVIREQLAQPQRIVPQKIDTKPSQDRSITTVAPQLLRQATQSMLVFEQTISGRIIDQSTNEPLPGVNILAKGTTTGTITDVDGNYRLTVADEVTTLVFSSIGYQSIEEEINGRTVINLGLDPDIQSLSEVIITGYGEMRRESVTGAIGNIKAEELQKIPSLSTSDRLVGRMAGLTTRKADSRPGAGTAIQIRNMGDPLYVIDGVPADFDDFNELGQNDIEQISVLKDASAAVYGLRASNGVVLVTTKRGKYGQAKTEVNLTGYFGLQGFTRYPQPANAFQYQRAKVESDQNQGNPPSISAEELELWRQGGPGYESYDYYDIIMDQWVPEYNFGANVSGGAENVRYFVSVNHAEDRALIDEYKYSRTNIQVNVDGKLSDRLTIGTQIRARREVNQQVGAPGGDDYNNPMISVMRMWPMESQYANNNPNFINQTHNVNVNPATFRRDVSGILDDFTHDIKAQASAEYDFGFGLKATGTYLYSFAHIFNNAYEFTYAAYRYDPVEDRFFTRPGWGNDNPFRDDERAQYARNFGQFRLNYDKAFGDHSISALLAYEQQEEEFDFRSLRTFPLTNQIPIQYTEEIQGLDHVIYQEARAGIVGRINYDYQDKYFLEVLGRYDGSFLFAPERRWGLFPGVSAGWRISEESFLESNNWLTNLKLRASYGEMGSETFDLNPLGVRYTFEIRDRIFRNRDFIVDPYSYLVGYDFQQGGATLDGEQVIGTRPRGLPVTSLSWITNRTVNLGLDFSLFSDKIAGTIDVFQRTREGLPAPRTDVLLPVEVGYSLPDENLNSDAIRGIEGSLGYFGRTEKFSYNISVNATLARRRSISTYRPRFENSIDEYFSSREDRWSDIFFGYEVVGRFQSEEEIESYPVNIDGEGNRTLLPGDFIFKDVNEDGIINDLDERPIGYDLSQNPYLNYGLIAGLTYGRFQFELLFNGGTMQSWLRNGEVRFPFDGNGNSPEWLLEDRWHRADPYNNDSQWVPGLHPAIREGDNNHVNYRRSDFWLTNINYFRLRNLQVSYSLPPDLLERVGIERVNLIARGTNIFSIDNMQQYQLDPEIEDNDGLQYPQQRIFSLGFEITL